ncbi:MAG: 23S rRNA (adenine(2503)-C(2))-methyltransferase RlmN [Pseudomonadota bacterium]
MKDKFNLANLTLKKMEDFVAKLGYKPFTGRQLFQWINNKLVNNFEEMTDLSKQLRLKLFEISEIRQLKKDQKQISKDKTQKLSFKLDDNHFIESVIIPEAKRCTICISTQVGCALNCKFCMTAKLGFIRNLETWEIVDQVKQCKKESINPVSNIVFMGMGEPLLNLENVIKAIEILTSDFGLSFSHRKITVSTAGITDKIIEFGNKTDVNLAVSLNAPNDEIRSNIMPINKKYNLKTLLETLKDYPLKNRKRITFEYILLKDINDSDKDAQMLAKILSGLKYKLNLIPLNDSENIEFSSPGTDRINQFHQILINKNINTIIRKKRGEDIKAACGQLAGKQMA